MARSQPGDSFGFRPQAGRYTTRLFTIQQAQLAMNHLVGRDSVEPTLSPEAVRALRASRCLSFPRMLTDVRRHGPEGYSNYGQYRNWLRDEFAFRCVYCLRRETWLTLRRDYEIDHFLPKSVHRDVERDYDNLVYACSECNGTKAAKYLPSPESVAFGDCLRVDNNGEIHAIDDQGLGEAIIDGLRLDVPEYTYLRRRIIETIAEARIGSRTLEWCLGYPENLPNLSTEKEPKHNKRPEGIRESHYERKRREELPSYY